MVVAKRISCPRAWLALAALGFAPQVGAQQFVASVAEGCGSPGAGGQLSVPSAASVIAGDAILVSVASESNAITDLSVADARNNSYRPFGSVRADTRRFAAVNFLANVASALGTGDNIRVQVGHPAPAQEICFRAMVFRGLAGGIDALDTHAGSENSGAFLNVSAPGGQYAGMLNLAAFAYSGNAGSISTSGANVALPQLCTSGNTLCLVAAYALGTAAGPQSVAVTTGNPVPWAGSLASFYARSNLELFKNGFE